jgi:CheY-like chemotaxis protein
VAEKIPESLPPLWVDRAKFQRAVVHLVRNAVEAMPKGGTLRVQAEQCRSGKTVGTPRKAGRYIRLTFADTGVGISPQHLERIFDPFYTTHNRSESKGMGLPMVQGLVAQHGGWLEINSAPGEGTQVRLYFPAREVGADADNDAGDDDGTLPVLPAAPAGRVLVADDDKLMRRVVSHAFEADGWQVAEAGDNTEVVRALADDATPFDLLVLDVGLPGPTTEEALALVFQKMPQVKVLLVSGFALDEQTRNLLRMGDTDYMSKPFSAEELVSKVDEMMVQPA